jgi:HSP20 family protein
MATMTMIRWSPYRNLINLNREFGHLWDDFSTVRRDERQSETCWAPDIDLTENKEAYFLRADLPGVSKENIKVTLNENVLTLSGEKKFEKAAQEVSFHRSERVYGTFSRSFRLPETIDSEKIHAEFKDGVLSLTVPKAESVKPKEIEIK